MGDDFLVTQSLNVAWLVMAMASWMGLKPTAVGEAGMGALIKDIGVLCVPESIRFARRTLTENERRWIEQSPIHSLDILEESGAFSETSLIISYQCHEQVDCSGYPRGRHKRFIHPMAGLLAVADMYTAVACLRPGSRPMEGMIILLNGAKWRGLDPDCVGSWIACRGFPSARTCHCRMEGSARVIRSGDSPHTKPMLVLLEPSGAESDEHIDLQNYSKLSVVKALPLP